MPKRMSRVRVMSQVLEKKNLQKAFSKTSLLAQKGIYVDNLAKNSVDVIARRGLRWQRVGKVFVCLKAATRMMKIGKFFFQRLAPSVWARRRPITKASILDT